MQFTLLKGTRGEGSRGGKIVGRRKSGRAIYESEIDDKKPRKHRRKAIPKTPKKQRSLTPDQKTRKMLGVPLRYTIWEKDPNYKAPKTKAEKERLVNAYEKYLADMHPDIAHLEILRDEISPYKRTIGKKTKEVLYKEPLNEIEHFALRGLAEGWPLESIESVIAHGRAEGKLTDKGTRMLANLVLTTSRNMWLAGEREYKKIQKEVASYKPIGARKAVTSEEREKVKRKAGNTLNSQKIKNILERLDPDKKIKEKGDVIYFYLISKTGKKKSVGITIKDQDVRKEVLRSLKELTIPKKHRRSTVKSLTESDFHKSMIRISEEVFSHIIESDDALHKSTAVGKPRTSQRTPTKISPERGKMRRPRGTGNVDQFSIATPEQLQASIVKPSQMNRDSEYWQKLESALGMGPLTSLPTPHVKTAYINSFGNVNAHWVLKWQEPNQMDDYHFAYTKEYEENMKDEKFSKINQASGNLRMLNTTLDIALQSPTGSDEATYAALIMLIKDFNMRPGRMEDAYEKGIYGPCTFEIRHIGLKDGDTVMLDYNGTVLESKVSTHLFKQLKFLVSDKKRDDKVFTYYGEKGQEFDTNTDDAIMWLQHFTGDDKMTFKHLRCLVGTAMAEAIFNTYVGSKENVIEAPFENEEEAIKSANKTMKGLLLKAPIVMGSGTPIMKLAYVSEDVKQIIYNYFRDQILPGATSGDQMAKSFGPVDNFVVSPKLEKELSMFSSLLTEHVIGHEIHNPFIKAFVNRRLGESKRIDL